MRLVTFWNHKGGVGKTTLAVHQAYRAAARGLRVLLVDVDEQGNSFMWLTGGADKQRLRDGAVHEWSPQCLVMYSPSGVPSPAHLAKYDLVIIDTPPAIGVPKKLNLPNADLYVVPIDGVMGLAGAANVHADLGRGAPILFVLNKADAGGKRVQDGLLAELNRPGITTWPDPVPDNAAIARSGAQFVPVWDVLAPSQYATESMTGLSDGILARLGFQPTRNRRTGGR